MENPLPNQQDPDQDQHRNIGNVGGDSTNMTIEFLRARLLAERSVSRTARQRADELAKRVVELEEQLKIVSVQRKKAEKATAAVLAILENHGLSDFSEEFDSGSDEEVNNFESKMEQTNFREDESLVGSEIETPSLTGRSLSWKSGKDSPSSGGKKSRDFSLKKRNPFSSSSLVSSRRSAGGKSCRRIRQKETRSAVEEHTNGSIQAPQKTGDATEISKSSSGNQNLNILVDDSGDLLGNHMHNRDNKEMERALEHQAQLIGQYEEEEKAQREWEEKFRENDSSPVSCERGTTQSDITEERDETRADSSPCTVQSNGSIDLEAKPNVESVLNSEQSSSTSKISGQQPTPPLVSLSKGENTSGNNYGRHDKMPTEGSESLGSVLEALQQAKLSLNHKIKASPQLNGGSLKNAIELKPKDRPEIPVGSAGIFKVPSDFYPANITQNNTFLASNPRLSMANYYHDEQTAFNSANQLITGRSSETFWPRIPSHPNNSTYSDLNINGGVRDRMDTNIPFPSPYLYNSRNMETKNVRSSYASPTYPLHTDPMLLMPYGGERPLLNTDINRIPLHTSYGEERPFSSLDRNQVRSYPLYTDPMVRVPSGEERVFPSTRTGIGPSDLSFYNNLRPNMYR